MKRRRISCEQKLITPSRKQHGDQPQTASAVRIVLAAAARLPVLGDPVQEKRCAGSAPAPLTPGLLSTALISCLEIPTLCTRIIWELLTYAPGPAPLLALMIHSVWVEPRHDTVLKLPKRL